VVTGREWKDNIHMNNVEVGFEVVDWIQLVQDRLYWRTFANTLMEFHVS
jgi:hypothetical protein